MGDRRQDRFVVVLVQIVGNVEHWQHVYHSDGVQHANRDSAIKHGWRQHDHDDFLLAVVRDNRVVGTAWQYEDRPDEDGERYAIAEALGMEAAP